MAPNTQFSDSASETCASTDDDLSPGLIESRRRSVMRRAIDRLHGEEDAMRSHERLMAKHSPINDRRARRSVTILWITRAAILLPLLVLAILSVENAINALAQLADFAIVASFILS